MSTLKKRQFKLQTNNFERLYAPSLTSIEQAVELYSLSDAFIDQYRQGAASLMIGNERFIKEDVKYVYFPARALSKEIVAPWTRRATDFRTGTVLRDSAMLLENKPFQEDHSISTAKNRGRIIDPVWQEEFVSSDGVFVPAGINIMIRVNKALYPDLIEKMSGDRPDLQSVSVGIMYEAVRSHPDLGTEMGDEISDWEYTWAYVGRMQADGRMATWEVVNIFAYDEVSIVYDGASETSQILDENGVPYDMEKIDPTIFGKDQTREQFAQNFEKQNVYIASKDCKVATYYMSYSKSDTAKNSDVMDNDKKDTQQDGSKDVKLTIMGESLVVKDGILTQENANRIKGMFNMLSKTVEQTKVSLTEIIESAKAENASIKGDNKKLQELFESFENIKADNLEKVTKLTGELQELNQKYAQLQESSKKDSDFVKEVTEQKREQALKAYYRSLPVGAEPNKDYEKEIKEAEYSKLDTYIEVHSSKFVSDVASLAHCTNCNSSEHVRFTSHTQEPEKVEQEKNDNALKELARNRALGNK